MGKEDASKLVETLQRTKEFLKAKDKQEKALGKF